MSQLSQPRTESRIDEIVKANGGTEVKDSDPRLQDQHHIGVDRRKFIFPNANSAGEAWQTITTQCGVSSSSLMPPLKSLPALDLSKTDLK